jgi:hypothetical protein
MNGALDRAAMVGVKYLYLKGWAIAEQAQISSVTVTDSTGRSYDAAFHCIACARLDVAGASGSGECTAFGYRLLVELRSPLAPVRVGIGMPDPALCNVDLDNLLAWALDEADQRAIVASLTDPALARDCCQHFGLLFGATDRVCRTASGALLVEGWIAAPCARVCEARLESVDGAGQLTTTRVTHGQRPDVERALGNRLPSSYTCRGYRVRFAGMPPDELRGIRLLLADGRSYCAALPTHGIPGSSANTAVPAGPVDAVGRVGCPDTIGGADSACAPPRRGQSPAIGRIHMWWRPDGNTLIAIGDIALGEPAGASYDVVTDKGRSPLRADNVFTLPQPFVAAPGAPPALVLCVRTDDGNPLRLEKTGAGHALCPIVLPSLPTDLDTLIRGLSNLYGTNLRCGSLTPAGQQRLDEFFGAILAAVLRQRNRTVGVAEEAFFGFSHRRVALSAVIYAAECQPSLHTLQLLKLAAAADTTPSEWILVTTPAASEAMRRLLARVADWFGVSSRLLVLDRLAGPATAANRGALAASGDHLLFLAPDVVPETEDWLTGMCRCMRSDAAVGAVGARLHYSDGAIQHLGMRKRAESALDAGALPDLLFQGIAPDCAALPPEPHVLAVSSACLLTSARLHQLVDGFDEEFAGMHAADADFGHKLRNAGFRVILDTAAQLTCLESDSQRLPCAGANGLARYDAVRYRTRWAARPDDRSSRQDECRPADASLPMRAA